MILAERHPAEAVVDRRVVLDLDDHVAVLLPQVPRALLALEFVHEHPDARPIEEVFEVGGRGAAMHAREVAARRLDRRRQLHGVDVAGLDLGLHEEVPDAAEDARQDAEDADLGLVHDRLIPLADRAEVGADANAFHGEEPARVVRQAQRRAAEAPSAELRKRHPRDAHVPARPLPVQPLLDLAHRQVMPVGGDCGAEYPSAALRRGSMVDVMRESRRGSRPTSGSIASCRTACSPGTPSPFRGRSSSCG